MRSSPPPGVSSGGRFVALEVAQKTLLRSEEIRINNGGWKTAAEGRSNINYSCCCLTVTGRSHKDKTFSVGAVSGLASSLSNWKTARRGIALKSRDLASQDPNVDTNLRKGITNLIFVTPISLGADYQQWNIYL